MDLYVFAATAIPALWLAAGLVPAKGQPDARSDAIGRTAARVVLLIGEVAAVTTLALGRDGYPAAVLSAAGLVVGAVLAFDRYAKDDMRRIGVGRSTYLPLLVFVGVAVFTLAPER
jgi:hypothetical protein